jgi:Uncharacterized homolog of phage Mu protein gp47
MIDFSGYTAKTIERAMLGQVPKTIDTREGSMVQTAIGPVAWYLEGLYLDLEKVQNNAYADTAVGGALDLIVQERGIARRLATPAVRRGVFNVPIASGSRFKTINGADSAIFVSGLSLDAESEGYVYRMTCQEPGERGNRYVGNLIPITVVPGLTSAVLEDIITPGTEEEEDVALRARYFETFQAVAFGGNIQAYRNAILAIAGVGAVQVYPAWKGGGTVLCSILGDDFKPASQALVQTVQDIICPIEDGGDGPSGNGYGMAPIGAAVTITTATSLILDVTCDVDFTPGIQNGEETYQEEIKDKINEYLDTVMRSWGTALKGHTVDYSITVYLSRIIYSILTISSIANVSNVKVNGSDKDLRLTETAKNQQVPVLGRVVVNGG